LTDELGCGVAHANEITFVFGDFKSKLLDPKAAKLSEQIQTYWTNMAKYGTPNSANVLVPWPVYNKSADKHLELAEHITVNSQLGATKCDFWDSLPRQGPYDPPAVAPL